MFARSTTPSLIGIGTSHIATVALAEEAQTPASSSAAPIARSTRTWARGLGGEPASDECSSTVAPLNAGESLVIVSLTIGV